MNQKAAEIWAKWDPDLLNDDYAKKRIHSAQSKSLTPVKVDSDDLYAYFQGSHGRYETFLDLCPCGDFRRAHRPCKHIFRLAMELGLIDKSYQTDSAAIPCVKSELLPLNSTIDEIEKLSDDAQKLLLRILVETTKESPCKKIVKEQLCNELLQSGLLEQSKDFKTHLLFGSKKELVANLERLGLFYDPKWKAPELKDYCMEHYNKELEEYYLEEVSVFVPARYPKRKMHYYLHRKHDCESVYNDSEGFVQVRLLDTPLPDDDVTEQLIQRGYYQRINEKEYTLTIDINLHLNDQ